ncbi:DUF4350 domain-containing protein [Nocardioides antri]|uniref:DUF4350 domain-containing protein n=1 Tax=Nocardioides antri TaxID=2607659 RepID=A0A5B1LZ57_9ACTN|nr:DUF4350 domain-containing protein [Nocardioides antri]KAA1425953.1 DUF4350 domain-containing protein [Nocardioides antri]
MTTDTAPPATTDDPTTAAEAGFFRRNRIWFVVGLALALALAVAVWTGGGDQEYSAPLDPQNPDPEGAQALAQVLGDEGVDVTIARSAAELHAAGAGPGTTVVVTGADQLAPSTVERLDRDTRGADVVLVEPPHHVLREVEKGVEASYASDETSGDCGDERFDALSLTVDSAFAYDTADGCFPAGDGYVLAEGGGGTTYFGAGQALSNDQVLRDDNAAVVLRLLGGNDRLVWYLPTYDDAAEDEAVSLWTFAPGWLAPSLWLAFVAVIALMWWRGRRLGRLASEPLPVVVRAVETTRSRGRMYRRADDRAYAAGALRTAARRRLADSLRLGRGASEAEVISAVARHLGRRDDEIGGLLALRAPAPSTDDGLVRLAQELTQLDREVRRG